MKKFTMGRVQHFLNLRISLSKEFVRKNVFSYRRLDPIGAWNIGTCVFFFGHYKYNDLLEGPE